MSAVGDPGALHPDCEKNAVERVRKALKACIERQPESLTDSGPLVRGLPS